MSKIKLPFKLGADPELQVSVGQTKIGVAPLFADNLLGTGNSKFGNIGSDHNEVLEIRPKAGTPQELTKNIGELIKIIATKLPYCNLSALSFNSCIGGHIHFELVNELNWGNNEDRTNMPDILIKEKQRKLDELVNILKTFYLPIMASENKVSLKRRMTDGYGDLNSVDAVRTQVRAHKKNKDNIWTMEFRSPSPEWILTPKICQATLEYFSMIYWQYLEDPGNFKQTRNWINDNNTSTKIFRDIMLSENPMLEKIIIKEISKITKTFKLYPRYKASVDYILNPEKVYQDKYACGFDPIKGWKIKSGLKSYQPKIRGLKPLVNVNKDLLMAQNIIYNNDCNVGLFAEALAKNICQTGSRLKNNYFLFGMKQGPQAPIISRATKTIDFNNENRIYWNNTIIRGEEITSSESLKQATKLFQKMLDKYLSGTKEKSLKEVVIIGLPKGMRESKEYAKLFKLIADLEKNLDKQIKLEEQLQPGIITAMEATCAA